MMHERAGHANPGKYVKPVSSLTDSDCTEITGPRRSFTIYDLRFAIFI